MECFPKNRHIIGYIPNGELIGYYNKSKICVFHSFAREGVLTTMLEAASCGRPIITSNCCGMPDFLKHELNGLLVEPEGMQLG